MESANNQPNIEKLKINEEKEEQMKKEKEELREEKDEEKEMEEEKEGQKEKEQEKKEKEELTQFVKLFHAVLEKTRGDLSNEDIEEGVEDAMTYFRGRISNTCHKTQLNERKIMCGFYHRYSPLFAGKTRRCIAAALEKCEELISCFKQSPLNIVDVGGAAGSDLVGLFSALYEKKFDFPCLKVTVMDDNDKWETFLDGINELLKGEFGNASKLFKEKENEIKFVRLDVSSNEGSEKFLKLLKEADIVLIKGVVSTLTDAEAMYEFTGKVASSMKTGSLLLYIDSPTYAKYFSRETYNLRLIFFTETVDSSSSKSVVSKLTTQASSSKSEDGTSPSPRSVAKKFEPVKKLKLEADNKFDFSTPEIEEYGRGFAETSNQEIYIYVKED